MAWHFKEFETDFVSVADHVALTFPDDDWCFQLWLKLTDNDGASYQTIVSWSAFEAMPSFNWYIYEKNNASAGRIRGNMKDDDGTTRFPVTDIGTDYGDDTDWHHWLMMRDTANNKIRMFFDGVEDPAAGLADTNFDGINAAASLLFGKRTDSTYYFGGHLAEAAFWSGWKPSASQIAELVSGKSPIWFSNNLAWWIPMLDNFKEDIAGLTITNPDDRVEISAHPPQIIYPPGLARTIFLTGAV